MKLTQREQLAALKNAVIKARGLHISVPNDPFCGRVAREVLFALQAAGYVVAKAGT